LKNPLCVVFDIDDTVYLERDYARSGFAALGLWAGRWLDPRFGALCQQRFDAGERVTIFNRVLQTLGIEPVPELIQTLVELYRTHSPQIQLVPDALKALTDLRALAVPLAFISDGPAGSQSRKADALGLTRFSDHIVLTGLRGSDFAKPHLWAFEHIAAAVPSQAYIYVGDNPRKDFIAPRRLGWLTVRIRRRHGLYALQNSDPPPDFEFADCLPLLPLAARVLNPAPDPIHTAVVGT
jgi:putative hydrolase of the HAD superfamily